MRFILFSVLILLSNLFYTQSQSHWYFNYQAIAHDASGDTINNQSLSVEVGVYSDTLVNPDYEESHNVVTNDYGLFTFKIGDGSIITGTALEDLNWTDENINYYIN